jgi:hypothetical protein
MTNITKTNIATPPGSYEAYLYRYTNLKTNQQYVGIHKGSVDDAYNHSSKNTEFQEVFSRTSSELKYEVLYYGEYAEMQNLEYKTLKKADARNNPLFYNKSNGFPSYEEPDLDKCMELYERIISGEFNVGKEPLSLHELMAAIQVRFEHIPELQQIIKEKISDANGNTDKCNPVLIYESRGPEGEDLRGDGNHTVRGALASKHATEVPVTRVPYDIHKDLSLSELKGVSNLMNKKAEVTKKEMSVKDGTKHIMDNYFENSVPVESNSNVDWLKAYGFTGSKNVGEISRSINKAKDLIEKLDMRNNNQLFCNYKAAPHNITLENTVESFKDSNTVSIYCSSAKFAVDRVLEAMFAAKAANKKNIVIVIHHPNLRQAKTWKMHIQPQWIANFDYTLNQDFDITFYEMPTTMSDGS